MILFWMMVLWHLMNVNKIIVSKLSKDTMPLKFFTESQLTLMPLDHTLRVCIRFGASYNERSEAALAASLSFEYTNMPEQEFEIKSVGIKYVCDVCNEGELVEHGKIRIDSDTVIIPHKCTHCDHETDFVEEKYPKVIWRRMSGTTQNLEEKVVALEQRIIELENLFKATPGF